MNEYRVLFACRFVHEYYKDRKCRGMDVTPSKETAAMMKRRGFIWKKLDTNEWGVLEAEGTMSNEDDELVLKVRVADRMLWNVSVDSELESEIRVAMKGLTPGMVVEREYKVKRLRWEYLFVKRGETGGGRLELAEGAGRLNFQEMTEIDFMGKRALRTVSRETVGVCEEYDYQLRLVEWRNPGKRVLIKNVVFPVSGQFIADDSDCVRQVVFY